MASTLPPNILSYIGTFIDQKDRLDCALVCKHWTEPFLDAYWGRLEIGSFGTNINRQWGKLNIGNSTTNINTVISNRKFLINAHRVWAVSFSDVHLNDYERLSEFQRSFPGIRYLGLYNHTPLAFPISDALDWSLWQSLSYLRMSLDLKSETVFLQSLLINLSVLPCLVHLGFYQSYDPDTQYTLSWNDLEYLHKHLPRLEYLQHDFHFKPIPTNEIESIKAVEPAQTMTRIEFIDYIDTHWLFYFASKYPSLRHFTCKEPANLFDKNQIDYDRQYYQADLQLLSTLDQFFPCLKRAVTTLKYENKYLWFIFFETLGHFVTKIEHVDLPCRYDVNLDDINRCIQPISESLKFLKIDLKDDRQKLPFAVCPRLVTLYIDGDYLPLIEVDKILECFPALRSLSLVDTILLPPANLHTYTPHPLQKLKIYGSEIYDNTLHYLSICCSQLKHVSLVDLRYDQDSGEGFNEEDNCDDGRSIFDMSMTNLDTFVFTFTSRSVYSKAYFHKHYMIEQMETDNDVLQTTQRSSRINWYHICRDRTNRREEVLRWELGRRDIEFCQRYFKDFYRRNGRGKKRKDIKEDKYGFVQRRFWKKDLKYGVYVFRFKSVKSHIFRIKIPHHMMK